MRAPVNITLPVTPELTRNAHARLAAFAKASHLPAKIQFAADTALEELLQNVLDYSGAHEVRLQFSVRRGELHVNVVDDGRPFNPLGVSEPDVAESFDVRPVGGLGVFLARRMMDSFRYEHRDGCNRLSFVKMIK